MCTLLFLAFAASCTPETSPTVDTAATSTLACDAAVATGTPNSTRTADRVVPMQSPEQVVTTFGSRMKLVSTTASADVAAPAMREAYGGLVAPQLIERWARNPSEAPGRAVSSPWPERIEIAAATQEGSRATVRGNVVEMSSTGIAGRVPIRIELQQSEGTWLITGVELSPATQPDENAERAVAVVRDYYRAIDAREFRKAYAMWDGSGPPGQTFEQFEAGFADTKSVRVETGSPSRVEAAAGSRYVEVPVTIVATKNDGSTERFGGAYTLRRSVVEGGSPEWRLYRGEIRPR